MEEGSFVDKSRVFLIGAAVGAGLMLVVPYIFGFISDGIPKGEGPYDYATMVSKSQHDDITPVAVIERLEKNTNRVWNNRLFQDRSPIYGGVSLRKNKTARASLSERVMIPSLVSADVQGLISNVLDDESVANNGAFYLVWFNLRTQAEALLRDDPKVFLNSDVEARRRTYLAGTLVIYYSPPPSGGVSDADMKRFVTEVAVCPTTARRCEIPAGF